LAALAAGRPVILATLHFGVYAQTRLWLRARGLPAATLAGGTIEERSALLQISDRHSPTPEIPVAFYQDQLRELKHHLSRGRLLIITCDGPAGKKISVPFGEGWTLDLATGALRLAAHEKAEIFPFTTVDLGGWRTRIKIGPPVPLAGAADFPSAAAHLIAALLPALREHPDQITFDLARSLRPSAHEP
jgi:lauroyl/myristoyl acyltransferase